MSGKEPDQLISRAPLIEPLEWLAGVGAINMHELTRSLEARSCRIRKMRGSFFKVYPADTGLMFYKLRINPRLWIEAGLVEIEGMWPGFRAEELMLDFQQIFY